MERREGPEGEVRETHDGLRAQERPHPGTRPAPLSVGAEPQDRLEAARVSAGVPSVAPPPLAVLAAEGVDTSTLRFLAEAALDDVRMLEEEAARRKAKEAEEAKAKEERKAKYEAKMQVINRRVRDGTATPAEEAAWRRWIGSCRSFQFVDIPVVVQRPIPMVFLLGRPWRLRSCSIFPGGRCPCCATETWYPQCYCAEDRLVPTGAVLGQGRCARVVQRQMRGSMVLHTVVPQLQSTKVVDIPFVHPHGLALSEDH